MKPKTNNNKKVQTVAKTKAVADAVTKTGKSKGAAKPKHAQAAISKEVLAYNAELKKGNKGSTGKIGKESDREICDILAAEITKALPGAENKIWHRNPVWFLDGNPIVGYAKLKDSVQLLFWSGQTFGETSAKASAKTSGKASGKVGLENEGSFKAAQARYTSAGQIIKSDLRRWLKKSKEIQWDYKNIVKRRGKLVRLK